MTIDSPSITAPACSLQEAEEVLAAGADEVYCCVHNVSFGTEGPRVKY